MVCIVTDMNTIDTILKDIYIETPLYGEVLINCKRIEDNSLPFVAAVSATLQIFVNPSMFNKLEYGHKKAIIIHEILHLLLRHPSRMVEEFKKNPMITNIAMDCAINQFIPNLPKDCVTLDYVKLLSENKSLKEKQSAEYYYIELMKKLDAIKKKLKNAAKDGTDGTDEQHEKLFEDYDKLNPLEKAALEEVIEKAISSQQKHDLKKGTGAGNEVLQVIPKKEKCINKSLWKSAINKNFGEEPKGNHEYRYGVQSRRNKNSYYGKKRILESSHVYVGLDTSGSITDDELSKFASQINSGIKSSNSKVTLIECDYKVQKVTHINKINSNGIKLAGRGGTDLRHITKWIIDNRPKSEKKSYLILLTDGVTDWTNYQSIHTTAIYTKTHKKIESITLSAVLY